MAVALKAPGIRIAGGLATRGQKDFALLYPNFDADMAALAGDVPKLDDPEILLRLMRIVAAPHVAHNKVRIPLGMGFLSRLPLDFTWLDDGLAVTGATPDYSLTLGTEVVSIGGLTPAQLTKELAPFISYENDTELHRNVPDLIPAEIALKHLKLIGPDGLVAVRLQKPGGEPFTLQLRPALGNVKKTGLYEGLQIPAPFYNSRPGKVYWEEYLPGSQTLYIQYNACRNDAKLPFSDFAKQVFADADAHPVKRVVVDLRRNGGGNSRVIGPRKAGLAARRKSIGKLYVFIGPYTFSSAVDNAVELQRELGAVFVGEASGGMPDGYGEVSTVTLPNSKLVVQFTTKRWGAVGSAGPVSLVPKIAAPLRLTDILASRDPALDAVTSLP